MVPIFVISCESPNVMVYDVRIWTSQKRCHKHRVTIPCKGLSISHEIRRISWNPYEIRRISGEIHPKPCKIRRVFAETSASDFWNIWFHMKSTGFHEICQISWISQISWNPPDFMVKSTGFHGFHGEIHQISWWNLPDFMVKSTRFHGEICQISWNPPDFMNVSFWVMIKYRSFYWKTNHRVTIPCKRSFDFTWNPPDFMKSVWNLVDFRWNPPQTL